MGGRFDVLVLKVLHKKKLHLLFIIIYPSGKRQTQGFDLQELL